MLNDLNCDMGELQATWNSGRDKKLLKYLSSINISCGAHAGNPELIRSTIKESKLLNLNIGAHPSFPDRKNFGRVAMVMTKKELDDSLRSQLEWIKNEVEEQECALHHIKPHGALYNMAAKQEGISYSICEVLLELDTKLILFCPSKSVLSEVAKRLKIVVWEESFIDRQYHSNGELVNRNLPNAVIEDVVKATEQFEQLRRGKVLSIEGKLIELISDTICIHGDNSNALNIVKALKFKDD